MGDYLRNINWKHVLIMCIGNILVGMGVGIFKLSGLGNDPFSGMNMAVADKLRMSYGNFQLIVNIVLLLIEIGFGRKFLGIGTVVNAVFLAYICTFFYDIFSVKTVTGACWTAGKTDRFVHWCCNLLSGIVYVSDDRGRGGAL